MRRAASRPPSSICLSCIVHRASTARVVLANSDATQALPCHDPEVVPECTSKVRTASKAGRMRAPMRKTSRGCLISLPTALKGELQVSNGQSRCVYRAGQPESTSVFYGVRRLSRWRRRLNVSSNLRSEQVTLHGRVRSHAIGIHRISLVRLRSAAPTRWRRSSPKRHDGGYPSRTVTLHRPPTNEGSDLAGIQRTASPSNYESPMISPDQT